MKLSINPNPILLGTENKLTKVVSANMFLEIPELNGDLTVPVDLLQSRGTPFVSIGQPMYKDRDGNRKISYHTIHLSGSAEQRAKELVTATFLITESKRLLGSGKCSEFEYDSETKAWYHVSDRELGTVSMSKEDADWMANVRAMATANAEAAAAKRANVDAKGDSKSNDNEGTVAEAEKALAD